MDVCLIFTNLAIKGNPPARLITVLFLKNTRQSFSLVGEAGEGHV